MKTIDMEKHFWNFRIGRFSFTFWTIESKTVSLKTKANDGMFIESDGRLVSTLYKVVPYWNPSFSIYYRQMNVATIIRNFLKRIWFWRDILRISKEIRYYELATSEMYDDPMCGCPEDFAEDYSRKIRGLLGKLSKYGVQVIIE